MGLGAIQFAPEWSYAEYGLYLCVVLPLIVLMIALLSLLNNSNPRDRK